MYLLLFFLSPSHIFGFPETNIFCPSRVIVCINVLSTKASKISRYLFYLCFSHTLCSKNKYIKQQLVPLLLHVLFL
ncbi:hypothetical protein GcM3_c10922o24 [Golovinomyces cichoracearum]|uniref:Secreted protein n=1 Tax=Golovinomyces cichoracearum TaxID=62708 RepID=A0A420JAM0_9PEZI|nr:hypothetical protein GcM3_c10922o24 [Golovinomyces cichoracearum]